MPSALTFESIMSQMGTGSKQLTDRYADYGAPIPDHHFYAYEPPTQGHVEASSKHTYGGVHKSNSAMSALTLLAFLFFLHILQQCIKDHMAAMSTPQITIMTAGREGETPAKNADAKIDKTGYTENKMENNKNELAENNENKYLTKINTAEPPRRGAQNYKNALKTSKFENGDRKIAQSDFVSAMDEQIYT